MAEPQAPSPKPQAPSPKPQASSRKPHPPGVSSLSAKALIADSQASSPKPQASSRREPVPHQPESASVESTGVRRIGDVLIKYKLINQSQLAQALEYQKNLPEHKLIGRILIDLGFITEIQLTIAIAKLCQIPFLQIGKYNVNEDAIQRIPTNVARRLGILPLDVLGNILTIAMVNPFDYNTTREVEFHTGMKVKRVICLQKDLNECLDLFYPEELEEEIEEEKAEPLEPEEGEDVTKAIADDLDKIFSEAESHIRTSLVEKDKIVRRVVPSSLMSTEREPLISAPSQKAVPLSEKESWEAFKRSPEYIFDKRVEDYLSQEVIMAVSIPAEVFEAISDIIKS
jgi:hypothetical protein